MSAKTVDTTGITPLGMLTLTYLLNSSTSGYNGDETNPTACPSYGLLASPTSLGEHNGDVDSPRYNIDDSHGPYNNREVISSSYETSNINEYTIMVEDLTWEVAPQITISEVTSKNQDINLYDSGANILTSGPHGQR